MVNRPPSRALLSSLFALLTATALQTTAANSGPVVLDPGGLPVCAATGEQLAPRAIPAANGAAIVVWQDKRRGGSLSDIYGLSVAANGTVTPGWPDDGLLLCGSGTAGRPVPVPDGAGGALVVWPDGRNNGQIFVQRVSAAGIVAAGWPADGKQVTTVVPPNGATTGLFDAISDGAGGAYLARKFTTSAFTPAVIVDRVAWDGTLYWAENSVSFTGAFGSAGPQSAVLAEDPGAGVFVALTMRSQSPESNGSAMIARIQGGTKLWEVSPPASTDYPSEGVLKIDVASDAAGGVFSTWQAYEYYNNYPDYGQRYSSSGAPQWPAGTTAPTYQYVEPDGTGGAFLIGSPYPGNRLEVHRRLADGSIPAGWTLSGITVSTPAALGGVARNRIDDDLLLCWSENQAGADYDLRAIAIDPSGVVTPGWVSFGNIVSDATGDQTAPDVALMSPGQFLACWQDTRTGASDIRAARVSYVVTGVPPASATTRVALGVASPNPARERVRFSLALLSDARVTGEVVDMSGRVVNRIGSVEPGASQGLALDTHELSPGIYWLRITQGAQSATRRFAVLR